MLPLRRSNGAIYFAAAGVFARAASRTSGRRAGISATVVRPSAICAFGAGWHGSVSGAVVLRKINVLVIVNASVLVAHGNVNSLSHRSPLPRTHPIRRRVVTLELRIRNHFAIGLAATIRSLLRRVSVRAIAV
jgi:hypothetical protein